jgi:hypothetical protein
MTAPWSESMTRLHQTDPTGNDPLVPLSRLVASAGDPGLSQGEVWRDPRPGG